MITIWGIKFGGGPIFPIGPNTLTVEFSVLPSNKSPEIKKPTSVKTQALRRFTQTYSGEWQIWGHHKKVLLPLYDSHLRILKEHSRWPFVEDVFLFR